MALKCIAQEVCVNRVCPDSGKKPGLMTDTGTQTFFLFLPNEGHSLEDAGYYVDLDTGQTICDLLHAWDLAVPPSEPLPNDDEAER